MRHRWIFNFFAMLCSVCLWAQRPALSAYSAEEVRETTQVLADGTRIHTETQSKFYRDSAGRVRNDNGDTAAIYDPVADVGFLLDLKNKTVHKLIFKITSAPGLLKPVAKEDGVMYVSTGVLKDGSFAFFAEMNMPSSKSSGITGSFGSSGGMMGAPGSNKRTGELPNEDDYKSMKEQLTMSYGGSHRSRTTPPGKRHSKIEDLEPQFFDGFKARGIRTTTMVDADTVGNDHAFQIENENWYCEELKMDVLNKHFDPRTGEQITRLINIVRGDPVIDLFMVPPGFKEQ